MTLAYIFYLIICIFLVITSLLSLGQSGSAGLFSSGANNILGTAKTSFLNKLVGFLAVLFFLSTVGMIILNSSSKSLLLETNTEQTSTEQIDTQQTKEPTTQKINSQKKPQDESTEKTNNLENSESQQTEKNSQENLESNDKY